jgi:hypothetical protein
MGPPSTAPRRADSNGGAVPGYGHPFYVNPYILKFGDTVTRLHTLQRVCVPKELIYQKIWVEKVYLVHTTTAPHTFPF